MMMMKFDRQRRVSVKTQCSMQERESVCVCATERGERKCVFGTFENLTTTKFGKVDGTVIRTSIIVMLSIFQ
jgi:hypothetical protein